MSDVHQVLPSPPVLTLGRDGAARTRARTPSGVTGLGRRAVVGAALIAGDLAAVWLAAAAAQRAMTFAFDSSRLQAMHLPAELIVLIFLALGLYPPSGESPFARFRLRGIGIVLFVALDSLAIARTTGLLPLVAYDALIAALLLVLGFYIEGGVRLLALRCGLWTAPTVLVGCGEKAQRLYRTLIAQPELGLAPVGFLRTASDEGIDASALQAPVLGSLKEFGNGDQSVEVAILTSREQLATANPASECPPPVQLILLNDADDIQTLWLRTRSLGSALGIQFKRDPYLSQNRFLKRSLDLAIAVPAAILSLPLIAALALLIWLVDRHSPFYSQQRVGKGGKTFDMPKLRTMYHDAPRRLTEYLQGNPQAQEEWERYFKLTNDPRVLPLVGNFIRRTSLDELPQLWSVIKGDMSLVGPRPFPQYHVSAFGPEFRQIRASGPPGLTGLWQVTARSNGDLDVQQSQDTFYIRNWSIWLDLYILLQTVPVLLTCKGAK